MRKWIALTAGVLLALGTTGQVMATRHSQKHASHKHTSEKPASQKQASDSQVRQLFEVMHLSEMFGQMNTQMAGVMGKAVPCVPMSYWQGFIDAGGTEQLLTQMVPVYQRHFTAEDVAGLLKFYQSTLGQKVITQMPQTMAEGMKIGQAWGRQRGEAMVKELQQQGKLDASGRCPASPAASSTPLSAPAKAKSAH